MNDIEFWTHRRWEDLVRAASCTSSACLLVFCRIAREAENGGVSEHLQYYTLPSTYDVGALGID